MNFQADVGDRTFSKRLLQPQNRDVMKFEGGMTEGGRSGAYVLEKLRDRLGGINPHCGLASGKKKVHSPPEDPRGMFEEKTKANTKNKERY